MRSIRNINDPAERPEVGTSEAAVSTCVSLIAGMCEQPEAIMEYWLDLYYYVRAAHERETIGQCPDIIRKEELLPELRKLWMEVLSVPFKPNAEFGMRNAECGISQCGIRNAECGIAEGKGAVEGQAGEQERRGGGGVQEADGRAAG